MDDAEIGSKSAAFMDRMAVAAVRADIVVQNACGPSALNCTCCGDPIPKARREAQPGCTMCVECKAATERG